MKTPGEGCYNSAAVGKGALGGQGENRKTGGFLHLLVPDAVFRSLADINPLRLREQGFRAVILDVDNTLVAWDQEEPPPGAEEWLARVRAAGLAVCLVSNNTKARVGRLAARLGVPGIPRAVKPRRGALRRALDLLGLTPGEVVAVGDQVFTDVLAAKRLGMRAYLVNPIGRREFVGTRLVRRLETAWLRHLVRKGRIGLLGETP